MAFQARHRWMLGKINEGLGLNDEGFVERSLRGEATLAKLNRFFRANGPDYVLFFFQPREDGWENLEDRAEKLSSVGGETRDVSKETKDDETAGGRDNQREEEDDQATEHIVEEEGYGKALFITDGKSVPLRGQCVYFFRARAGEKEKRDLDPSVAGDGEISFGTLTVELLKSYETVLSKTLKPLIDAKDDWQKASTKETREFCSGLDKFVESVQENLQSLTAGLELARPRPHFIDLANASTKASPEVIAHFVDVLNSWSDMIESCLDEDEQSKWNNDDKGPYTEIEYWRRRTQRLASITEQLKTRECRTVISTLQSLTKNHQQQKLGAGSMGAAFSLLGALSGPSSDFQMQSIISLLRRWRQIDINITEAANEAKDNVKYLATLEKFIDPLYNGSPETIIDTLPALMNSIKMIHTIARYYNTTERMTGLFMKITNQMIINCKRYLTSGLDETQPPRPSTAKDNEKDTAEKEKSRSSPTRRKPVEKSSATSKLESIKDSGDSVHKIWDRDPERLLRALETCLRLNEAYQEQYHITKDKLLTMPKGRQFDFSETQIFGKMDLFCRRVIKLIDMFSTIHQFNSLAKHQLEGMEGLTAQFKRIVLEFRDREHDVLDFYNNKFDRDYIQFNVRITDLESLLQQFINRSFESITSIEASLSLLKKFQTILQRENLKSDLDSKFTVIFHNYGLDLTTVQEIYEKHKHSPPISRNMPPVAGSIMWARHLLRRIEEPMRKFEMNQSVLSTKDSKKIIKTYNKVAKTLVAFEYLWYEAWCNSVEAARAGLQATLIIRHPTSKKLFVNFDPDILQLIREAKCLERIGIEIPASAQMVLLQESKFKHYHNELTYLLREYDRVVGMILPVARGVLRPHVQDLDLTLRPGMVTLTWTSMNIDTYKANVQTALARFEELIVNINDVIENRVEKNLKQVGKAILVDLPTDGLLTLDEFVQKQEKFVKKQTLFLESKNVEIETAVLDLVRLVKQYRFSNAEGDHTVIDEEHFQGIISHYNRMMYQGLLQATKNSLAAIKTRVCAKGSTGFLYLVKPFFEVDVQLSVPSVRLVPSLDEVQNCINKSAQSILWSTKSIWEWGQLDTKLVENAHTGQSNKISFFERIGKDVQIVRSVLLLTGALLGTKNHVRDYLSSFSGYDWLWKEDMEYQYKKFIDRNPSIEDFEHELSRFVAIENQIRQIAGVHNIGALSLNTNNLKLQLQSEASQWKVQYSDKVHQQAFEAMEELLEYIRVTQQRVAREVNSLESLRYVMNVLKEVRERESTIEQEITPILDMYDMLDHYLPAGVVKKDEMDKKSVLRSSWRKLGDCAEEITDQLAGIQGKFKVQLIRDVKGFAHEVSTFRTSYLANGPMVVGLKPKEAVERLRRFKNEYEVLARKQETLTAGEELFALKSTVYPELVKTKKELNLLDQLYGLYIDVVDTMEQYRNQLWVDCVKNVGSMSDKVNEFENRCKRLPTKLRDWDAFRDLRHDLTDFQSILPLLLELSKPSIKNRHWAQVSHLTGIRFNTETGKLKELWHQTMLSHKEEIEEICHGADKELEIEEKISAIKEKWASEHFQFAKWRQRDCRVLKGFGQIIEDLEESQLSCQSMLSMKYVAPFRDEVANILAQLSETSETLERWVKVQMLWMSLESVFTGGDIAKQMPQDAKKFAKIDKDFHKIMERAQESMGNVVTCCANEMLKNTLPVLYAELERCQKSLEGYLEQKRSKFPRFYFVSNSVLLQILSQGSDVESVQPYYEKIFDAISQVTHDEDDVHVITEMKSIMGVDREVVPFTNPVSAQGNIEDWLLSLEKEMQKTMKDICKEAALECQKSELLDFIDDFTAQFALLGLQFSWTAQVTEALTACRSNKSIMSETNKLQLSILSKLSSLCLTDLGSRMNRKKVETLVTIQVHQRDVFGDLFRLFKDRKLSSADDFEWLKQARFYWFPEKKDAVGPGGACAVSVCDALFDYSYEYLGCKERLVITPLTDRCYVTLTQALAMNLGGAPAGPAGTGKTETVKDLGRSLGLYVVVTNCTDQQRYTDLAKIFKGLCRAGIWGCFDEFNRIELPVLSVVAQQILAITTAKRIQSATLTFPGDPDVITLNPTVGYFITMNPGYAGRHELPENLKALFRSVAMMVPDREIIIRVKLCSVGYTKFSELAKKFNALYLCCEEQLSSQRHYDFGLRNILSVLRSAGETKRENQDQDEQLLVMQTLRDMNLSKFVAQDVPLFLSLLKDIFPNVSEKVEVFRSEEATSTTSAGSFEADLIRTIEKAGLQAHQRWVQKVIQVRETAQVRHGLMLIGPACGGKSKSLEVLTETETVQTGVPNKIVKINPKSVLVSELFGETDPVSNEWIDGVFSVLWQKYNDRSRKDFTWLVCDGPVDAIWIENLNTVLDDNKILTLANGDRIPMTDNVKLVFEAEDLNNASPATVSRAGIIFVSETDLDWEPVLQSWVQRQQETHMPILRDLFQRYVKECDLFLSFKRLFQPVIRRSRVSIIISMFEFLGQLMSQARLSDSPSDVELELEKLFFFALIWTLGGTLESNERKKFDSFIRSLDSKAFLPKLNGPEDTCFNYRFDLPETEWVKWAQPVWEGPAGKTPSSPAVFRRDFASILVPTTESERVTNVLQHVHRSRVPILLVGAAGTAKTSTAFLFFDKLKKKNNGTMFKKVNFSYATTPRLFQETVEGEVDKRGGKTYGPPNGHSMTIFVDDLSMPEANKWGDQPTLELLRQLIETRSMAFLDKDKRGDLKVIEDVQYVAAMNHNVKPGKLSGNMTAESRDQDGKDSDANDQEDNGVGIANIPNRLLRHFFVLNVISPDQPYINEIYGKMLNVYFTAASTPSTVDGLKKVRANAEKLLGCTISLWNKVKSALLPTPSKSHYVFTMRDISRVFQGLFRPQVETLVEADKALFQLWRFEADRVFSDKLTNDGDKAKFAALADEVASKELGKEVVSTFYYATQSSTGGQKPKKRETVIATGTPGSGEAPGLPPGSVATKELVTFVDFLREDEYDEDGILVREAPVLYEPAESMDKVSEKVKQVLEEHNKESPANRLDLVLFKDALRHLLRVVRVLGLPRGNLLLIGLGGSGKQSVTKLASYIVKHELFQIKLSKTYNINSLLDDMRGLYRKVGKERKPVTFLVTEAEIRDESFLQVVNSFLTSGEIVGLFPKDELAVMASEVRSFAVKEVEGFTDTPENMSRYFINYIRNNLHIVICMSPASQKYTERARRFPGLFSSSYIDWFLPWPKEALQAVSQSKLQGFSLDCQPAVQSALISHMGEVHLFAVDVSQKYFEQMRKRVYQTPKSFLAFLDEFKNMYKGRLTELEQKEGRVDLGLKKLAKGAQDVEQMKIMLAEEEVKLRDAEAACNSMLSSLEQSSMEAKKEAESVASIKSSCEAEAEKITEEKNRAADELAAAQPFLIEAEEAANSIKPNDLNELKKLPKPGDIIKLVFDCVMILRMFRVNPVTAGPVSLGVGKEKKKFDFVNDSYSLCQKTMLADSNFLKALFHFSEVEKDNINEETIELLMPYLELDGFDPSVARNASKACEGLCTWVIAMVKYHAASKVVKPKLEKLGMAEAKLEAALQNLDVAERNLQNCKDKLEELQERFQNQMSEKQRIEANTLASKKKMIQATALIEGLKDERERWTQDGKVFQDTKKRLVGDCALASAFLSYSGPFNQEFRTHLVRDLLFADLLKRKIPVTATVPVLKPGSRELEPFEMAQFLCDPITVGEWSMQSLPSDPLSIENGILVTRSSRYPLLVDPQGQGLQWIKAKEASRMPSFGVTSPEHGRFREQLELCMSEGLSLIVVVNSEDEIDPLVLDPVLEKRIVSRAKTKYITIGERPCEFSSNFRLFLVTQLPKPSFSPELQAKTTVVDFTVNVKGLEDQLLGHVIRKEQRALEEQLSDVLESVTVNSRQLVELNEELLLRLTENSAGNLLDDTELITVLANTKKAAVEVKEKLQTADETKVSINEKREQYRAVAARGAILYFGIVDMSNVNSMYETSLDQFMKLFLQSMEDSDKPLSVKNRVSCIVSALTYSVYKFVSRGLYKQDRMTFVLLVLLRILADAGHLKPEMLRLFLRGGAEFDASSMPPKPLSWLSDEAYANAFALSKLDFFRTLIDNMREKEPLWKKWWEENEPERISVPDYEAKFIGDLGPFLRLLLVRSLREDRTAVAAHDLIRASEEVEAYGGLLPCLGPAFVSPVTESLDKVFDGLTPDSPVLFLLSAGADPTDMIETYCKKSNKQQISVISMGEGQDKIALKALAEAITNGDAVLLMNAHLALSLMEQLTDILERVSESLQSMADTSEEKEEPEQTNLSSVAAQGIDAGGLTKQMSTVGTGAGAGPSTLKSGPPVGGAGGAAKLLSVNPKFRLFITTEPIEGFPISLLRRCVKITNEPPAGIKANLMRCYTELIDQERLDRIETEQWRKLMYTMCFLHGILQERRKYGPIGWAVPYEFSISDLDASLIFLERHLFAGDLRFEALQFMVSAVFHGGRVTHAKDKDLLSSLVDSYLQPNMLVHGYSFTPETKLSNMPVYDVVDCTEIENYVSVVSNLSDSESAEVLGLHPNATISLMHIESKRLLEGVLVTQPKEGASGAQASEAAIEAKAKEILDKLPRLPNATAATESVTKQGGFGTPANVFLMQEYDSLSSVLKLVETSLMDLISAIRGEIVTTRVIYEDFEAVSQSRPPYSWMFSVSGDEISWRSGTLGTWLEGLQRRVAQISVWINSGRPTSFWIAGFKNPRGFLTAIKQEVVRQHASEGWSLESVELTGEVCSGLKDPSHVRSGPREGAYLSGFYLEGAGWNESENTLREALPKQLLEDFPILYVTFAPKSYKRGVGVDQGPYGGYSCPVYRYSDRQSLIFSVSLPSKDNRPSHWRLRSTALLLQKDF